MRRFFPVYTSGFRLSGPADFAWQTRNILSAAIIQQAAGALRLETAMKSGRHGSCLTQGKRDASPNRGAGVGGGHHPWLARDNLLLLR